MTDLEQHITKEEWILYYSHEIKPADRFRLLQHISGCPSCRSLLEQGNDLRYALQTSSPSVFSSDTDEDEYQAVAGTIRTAPSGNRTGFISVLIENRNGILSFDDSSIESEGIGNKYALNLSGSELSDDEKLLSLILKDNTLFVTFNDPDVASHIAYNIDGDYFRPVLLNHDTELPLQINSFCKVELSFSM